LLLDLDGTIVDSLPDIAGALNASLGDAGLPPLAIEVVRGLVGEGVLRLAEKALAVSPSAPLAPAALAQEIVRRYAQRPCVATRLYAGMADALAALRARGVLLAVLTNKPGPVARALIAALSLTDTFEAVVGDGDGFARKPAPEAARTLAARFGVPLGRTLMVGDGLPDLAMARAAGCPVAAAAWGYTDREMLAAQHPDYLIATPAELLTLAPPEPRQA
jgi:phosphoglycolate phosphatase